MNGAEDPRYNYGSLLFQLSMDGSQLQVSGAPFRMQRERSGEWSMRSPTAVFISAASGTELADFPDQDQLELNEPMVMQFLDAQDDANALAELGFGLEF